MIREASALFQIFLREQPIFEDSLKVETLQYLLPQDPEKFSTEYLERFNNHYESFLEQMTFTVLVRYADCITQTDRSGTMRRSLDSILGARDASINQMVHALIGFIYPDTNPIENSQAISPIGVHLDITEAEAELVFGKTMLRINNLGSNNYPFDTFVHFSGIDNSSCAPVDTIIMGTLINFAIDIAMVQEQQYRPNVRTALVPLFLENLDTSDVLTKMHELSRFVGERIQYL